MEFEKLEPLVKHLITKELTIGFAESMTSGLAAAEFGRVPGVSSILLGGVVSYSPEVKKKVLKVNKAIIKEFSAESPQTTRAMAEGLKELLDCKISVAITGVAGKPVNDYNVSCNVGTTYICIIINSEVHEFRENFSKAGGRDEIRQAAVDFICDKLIELTKAKIPTTEEREEAMLMDLVKGLEANGELPRANSLRKFIEKKYKK